MLVDDGLQLQLVAKDGPVLAVVLLKGRSLVTGVDVDVVRHLYVVVEGQCVDDGDQKRKADQNIFHFVGLFKKCVIFLLMGGAQLTATFKNLPFK